MGMDLYHLNQQEIERLGRLLRNGRTKDNAHKIVAGVLRDTEGYDQYHRTIAIVDALWKAWGV